MSIIYTDKPLPRRYKNDLYPTPLDFCRTSLNMLGQFKCTRVLDPGAGLGAWGKAVKEKYAEPWVHHENGNAIISPVTLTGVDIDDKLAESKYYDNWIKADYLKLKTNDKFDLIVGNPPYSHAEEFVRKSFDLLDETGVIMFLLRLAFLESQERWNGLWQTNRPTIVYVSPRRLSFTGNRKSDNTAYGLFVWHSVGGYLQTPSMLDWIDWDYTDDVKYQDIGDIRVYNVIDDYYIHPETGEIYDIENFTTEGT